MGRAAALESEIKNVIVEALALEDVDPQPLETDAARFGEGLGLDSIEFVRTQGVGPRLARTEMPGPRPPRARAGGIV